MKRALPLLSGLAVMALFSGCYPDSPDYIEEYDLVVTNYSPTFDFTASTTYAIPDSVVKVTGALVEGETPEMVAPAYGDVIINDIKQNLNRRGWTEVQVGENPDVVLLPSVFTTTTISYYYPYYYWGWYGYYGGWYYPGYYPSYVTSYTTGTLLILMADPNEDSPTGNTPVVWTAAFNGLAEGSTSGLVTRIDGAIDQAFEQSSYLDHQP